jgi:hypothetical protein
MKVLRFLLVLGGSMVLVALPAEAATAPAATPAVTLGQGLEISPPVLELDASPGQTVNAAIKLRDITSGPLVVTGKADDFGAKNETGDPEILLNETGATRYSLKYWIPNVPSLTLQSEQEQTLSIPIVVPANAEPGGHYGVIRFTGLPPNLSGTGVSLSASLGALVLMRVAGNIVEQLQNTQFFASQNGHTSSFFQYGPITLSERIRNTGDVHVQPVGKVSVYDTFGRRIAQLSVNSLAGNILPDSVRRFDQTLNKRYLFGHYRATYDVTYGTSKKQLASSMTFWVIPWQLIIIVTALLLALVLLTRQGIRRYNRYIVGRAKRP